jgi:hypothetical protein
MCVKPEDVWLSVKMTRAAARLCLRPLGIEDTPTNKSSACLCRMAGFLEAKLDDLIA